MMTGAIIGFGKIAQTAHLPAYLTGAIVPRASICAVAEPDERVRADGQRKFPDVRFYQSAAELFEHEAPQFVDICTPPNHHSSMLRLALAHHTHILCEKPFALDILEARCLAQELRRRPEIVFMPCHQYTYSPLWNSLRSFVRASTAHEQVYIQASVYRTNSDPGIASDGKGWRRNWAVSGGGILSDTGVHYAALADWIFGMPEEVSCRTYHLDGIAEGVAEDTASVELKHHGGVFQFNLTWAADRRANVLRATTTRRSFVYDGGVKALEYQDGTCSRIIGVPDPSDKAHYISLYGQLLSDFFSMIDRGDSSAAQIDAALHASIVLDAAYRSAHAGAVIRFGAFS